MRGWYHLLHLKMFFLTNLKLKRIYFTFCQSLLFQRSSFVNKQLIIWLSDNKQSFCIQLLFLKSFQIKIILLFTNGAVQIKFKTEPKMIGQASLPKIKPKIASRVNILFSATLTSPAQNLKIGENWPFKNPIVRFQSVISHVSVQEEKKIMKIS